MSAERDELLGRVWKAWHSELPVARSAAHAVREGTGLFGQRRRHFREATSELAAFGARWQPVLPYLPSEPPELAAVLTAVASWMNTRRMGEQVDAYVEHEVIVAHPEAPAVYAEEQGARIDRDIAHDARTALDAAYYNEIKKAGLTGYATDAQARLDSTTADLSTVEAKSLAAGRRVARLQAEPAIAALGDEGLGALRDQWQQDRATAKAHAARERLERAQAEQRRRTDSWAPSSPERGWGIGR